MSKGYELECIVGWRAMTDIWRREEAEEPRWLLKPLEPRAWCWCNRSPDASRSRWWQHLPLWRSLEPCLEIKQIKRYNLLNNAYLWCYVVFSSVLAQSSLFFPCSSALLNGCTTRSELPQTLTHVHGKVDAHVDILCPHIVGGLGVEDWEDAAVQVGLASCLGVTGHGQDGGTGPVPGDQVGGPAHARTETHS